MKKTLIFVLLALLGAALFVLGFFSKDIFSLLRKPRVLASVNHEKITDQDLKRELQFLSVNSEAPVLDSTREDVLDRLINDSLIVQEAARLMVTAPEAEVNSRLAWARGSHTPEEFKEILREHHLTSATWEKLIRRQLLVEATIHRAVESQVRVGEDEVDGYYWSHLLEFYQTRRIHARQIVVETLEQAQKIRSELEAGANFQEEARKYSRAPEASEGGDLGWVTQTDLPTAFSQVLFKLKSGAISQPLSTEYGYHLFTVDEIQPGGRVPVEEAKAKVARALKQQKVDAAFQAWLEDLRSQAKIILYDLRGAE